MRWCLGGLLRSLFGDREMDEEKLTRSFSHHALRSQLGSIPESRQFMLSMPRYRYSPPPPPSITAKHNHSTKDGA